MEDSMYEPLLRSLEQNKQLRMAHSFQAEPSTHQDVQEPIKKLVKNV